MNVLLPLNSLYLNWPMPCVMKSWNTVALFKCSGQNQGLLLIKMYMYRFCFTYSLKYRFMLWPNVFFDLLFIVFVLCGLVW